METFRNLLPVVLEPTPAAKAAKAQPDAVAGADAYDADVILPTEPGARAVLSSGPTRDPILSRYVTEHVLHSSEVRDRGPGSRI